MDNRLVAFYEGTAGEPRHFITIMSGANVPEKRPILINDINKARLIAEQECLRHDVSFQLFLNARRVGKYKDALRAMLPRIREQTMLTYQEISEVLNKSTCSLFNYAKPSQ